MSMFLDTSSRLPPARSSERIRLYLVDDHDVVREGLHAILSREMDLDVVGMAASAEEALEVLPHLDPDVIVLDQRLPGMTGIELCREIAELRLRAQVVILSAFLAEETVEAALRAGARGYVIKDVEASELKRAIRAAAKGQTTIDPKVAGQFVQWAARFDPTEAVPVPPAQLQVLRLLASGRSSAQIARDCGLSYHTVKSYLRDIYKRLGVNSRSEATAVAMRRGWI